MPTPSANKSVKVAIVGMTGSGKTVLISTLAMKMAQMALEDIFMAPFGDNRRQTLRYTQSNWKELNEGHWPPSTPAGELIELQWELTTKNNQAQVQFLDCAGQDIRSLFQTDKFNPRHLGSDLKRVYENISTANILIFLVNMKDLLATPDYVNELMDLDQMFHTLNQRNGIPRKMAVVFSQYDKYKPEVDQKFNGDFLEYLRHYIPLLHGQYIRTRNFEIIPVAAVNDTKSIIEDGEVKQYPVPYFSSYNLEKLIHWIADSVEELAPAIQNAPKASHVFKSAGAVPHPEQLKVIPKYTYQQMTSPFSRMTFLYVFAYVLIILAIGLHNYFHNLYDRSSYISDFSYYNYYDENYSGVFISFSVLCIGACFIGGLFYEIRLLYRSWDVIQDGHAWTTPDKAVKFLYFPVLLFIPIVNIYWLYVNFYGLSKCLNNCISRYNLNVRPCSTALVTFTCLLYNIPFLNLVLPIFIFPFAMYSIMRTARDIQTIKIHHAFKQVPHPEQLKLAPQYSESDLSLPFVYMTVFYIAAYCLIPLAIFLNSYFSSQYEYDYANHQQLISNASIFSIGACFLIGLFFEARLLYRCWDVIQDGFAWNTPNKAIQLLFFPIFLLFPIINLPWLIVNFYGLHRCLNDYINRYQLKIKPSSSTSVVFTCIAYNIPYLNFILPIFFLPFAMYSIMRTARDIQKIKMELILNR